MRGLFALLAIPLRTLPFSAFDRKRRKGFREEHQSLFFDATPHSSVA
jgi:hypothetical protein